MPLFNKSSVQNDEVFYNFHDFRSCNYGKLMKRYTEKYKVNRNQNILHDYLKKKSNRSRLEKLNERVKTDRKTKSLERKVIS